jgi:hypothetical protein
MMDGVSLSATSLLTLGWRHGMAARSNATDIPPCYYALSNITPIGYKQHIKAADATIVIAAGRRISDNVRSLIDYTIWVRKPTIVVQLGACLKRDDSVARIADWIRKHRFRTLNIAVSHQIWGRVPRGAKMASGEPWEPVIFLILNVSDALSRFCNLSQVVRIVRPPVPRKSSTGRIYRHGDLLIRQLKRLPGKLQAIQSTILARGEATGHSHELHQIDGSLLQVYESSTGTKYFKTGCANLTHQEHGPIFIEKGSYSVRREREFDYFEEPDREWDEDYGYFWERRMGSNDVDD